MDWTERARLTYPPRRFKKLHFLFSGEGAKPIALVNHSLAKICWPNEDPIGRRIRFGRPEWAEAVGVIRDVRILRLVAPTDASVMATACLVVVVAALAACIAPARTAARVDPVETLRAS